MEEAQDIDRFRKLAFELSDEMIPHLNDEESFYPKVLEKYFTEEEHAYAIDKIIQAQGMDGNKVFLPWVIDAMNEWGGTEVADDFFKAQPDPVKAIYNASWKPYYETENKGMVKAIKGNKQPKDRCCLGCL